jgi:hypothetical protein
MSSERITSCSRANLVAHTGGASGNTGKEVQIGETYAVRWARKRV